MSQFINRILSWLSFERTVTVFSNFHEPQQKQHKVFKLRHLYPHAHYQGPFSKLDFSFFLEYSPLIGWRGSGMVVVVTATAPSAKSTNQGFFSFAKFHSHDFVKDRVRLDNLLVWMRSFYLGFKTLLKNEDFSIRAQ